MRQIVLDTETTGLETSGGHRIIEIGCVEVINRRLTGNNFHQFLQPDRKIDQGAFEVHGISNKFLADKPRFADIWTDFLQYVEGAELIIHNAPFDVGFLNHEIQLLGETSVTIDDACTVLDTLQLARKMHPGQRNNLDALCKRYDIDNTQRTLHGALLDAEILADVYLMMTGGQTHLLLGGSETEDNPMQVADIQRLPADRNRLALYEVAAEDKLAHQALLQRINKESEGTCLWGEMQN
ncbi:MAG: DNA polymerase III subunit epsilon [Gammaproteobacteria bacterium]|nr:DNA polymerase III subunit epsilon [Gammaproteobacteria bacterium]